MRPGSAADLLFDASRLGYTVGGLSAILTLGLVLGVLALLNLRLLTLLPFRWQVPVMWAELLILFLAYPLGLGIWISFTDAKIGRPGEFGCARRWATVPA